jgi:hypothetical protein
VEAVESELQVTAVITWLHFYSKNHDLVANLMFQVLQVLHFKCI